MNILDNNCKRNKLFFLCCWYYWWLTVWCCNLSKHGVGGACSSVLIMILWGVCCFVEPDFIFIISSSQIMLSLFNLQTFIFLISLYYMKKKSTRLWVQWKYFLLIALALTECRLRWAMPGRICPLTECRLRWAMQSWVVEKTTPLLLSNNATTSAYVCLESYPWICLDSTYLNFYWTISRL